MAAAETAADTDLPELGIATDSVCYIIVNVRQFDVKEGVTDPDSGSDAPDDGYRDVLEQNPEDPVYRLLTDFISGLDLEEQINLVALAWLGRGRSTTTAPRNICSGCRCWAITSKRDFRNSAAAVRTQATRAD